MVEPTRASAFLRVHAAGATDIGKGRTHNADAVLLRPDLHLFAVADGTGGSGGNVASALATASIANFYGATDRGAQNLPDIDAYGLYAGTRRLAAAVQKANQDIVEVAKTSSKHRGMGSTIVAASVSPEPGLIHVVHVGDSRAYRLRHGLLEQLTTDHSLLHDVLELRPEIDDDALAQLPENVVTRALGMKEGLRVASQTHPVLGGDRYLLCSDGLSDALSEDAIREALGSPGSPDEIVRRLIALVNEAGGKDNIAAIVLACELPPGAALRPKRVAPRRQRLARPPESRPVDRPSLEPNPEDLLRGMSPDELGDDEPTRQNRTVGLGTPRPGTLRGAGPPRIKTPRPHGTMRMVRCPKCGRAIEPTQPCPTCGGSRSGVKR